MSRLDPRPLSLGLVLLLGACVSTNRTSSDLPVGPLPDAGPSAPVLYARDGSVVQSGAVVQQSGPAGDRATQEGSRTYLLELYQKAIDEKESMSLELKNLAATLEKSRSELAVSQREKAELQKRFDALEQERTRLEEEGFDLAGRLVTAQIRRLEAEKILLESKIEWQRLEEKSAAAKAKPAAASARNEAGAAKTEHAPEGHKP